MAIRGDETTRTLLWPARGNVHGPRDPETVRRNDQRLRRKFEPDEA